MSDRFYCAREPVEGRLVLDGEEAHHALRVRRVGQGSFVELFDGKGGLLRARVLHVRKDRLELGEVEQLDVAGPEEASIALACAVPKGERFDWLVEKATELGVARLVPVIAERSVVEPRPAKMDRLRRVMLEACKQSNRLILMELAEPVEFRRYLQEEQASLRWLAHPGLPEPARGGEPRAVATAALAIGPEGGFTLRELEEARSLGWLEVGLGPTILRVETAAIYGVALLRVELRADQG